MGKYNNTKKCIFILLIKIVNRIDFLLCYVIWKIDMQVKWERLAGRRLHDVLDIRMWPFDKSEIDSVNRLFMTAII